jgi:flavin-dependent dehydrogenase
VATLPTPWDQDGPALPLPTGSFPRFVARYASRRVFFKFVPRNASRHVSTQIRSSFQPPEEPSSFSCCLLRVEPATRLRLLHGQPATPLAEWVDDLQINATHPAPVVATAATGVTGGLVSALRAVYDAIVVGARCAGAPTAMLLARAGARVLLLDRAGFPSDTISGHAIKSPGVAYLQRWGLLDAVLATNCPPIYDFQVTVAGRAVRGSLPTPESQPVVSPVAVSPPVVSLPVVSPPVASPAAVSPVPDDLSCASPLTERQHIVAPRRTLLDAVLLKAAADAGVDVHTHTPVTSLLRNNDQVVGIEARSVTGQKLRALAPIVIGADGKQSFIAHQVGAAYEQYTPPVSIAYYTYWSGCFPPDAVGLHFAPGRAAGLFPTNDGQWLAFVQTRWSTRHVFRADAMPNYLATLQAFPAVAETLSRARHDDQVYGMLDLPAFFRRSYGPGWALVGDAAHHKDPLIARGITDAFRDADLLARAVASGLGGETDLTPAMARYQAKREASSWRVSALNHRLAELPDDPAELESRLIALGQAEATADAELASLA